MRVSSEDWKNSFEFRWIKTRRGIDTVRITTDSQRIRRRAANFKDWCRKHRDKRMAWIMGMVKTKLNGLKNYFGVVGNLKRVRQIYDIFRYTLYRWLNRRSERKSYNWETFMHMWHFYNVSNLSRLNNEGLQLSFLQYLR